LSKLLSVGAYEYFLTVER